jgi:hypothetical protein
MSHAVRALLDGIYLQYKPLRLSEIKTDDLQRLSALIELTDAVKVEINNYLANLFVQNFNQGGDKH